MIKTIDRGIYTLVATKDKKRILYLKDQGYLWIYAKGIGDLFSFSRHAHATEYILAKGAYRIFNVNDEPMYVDLEHLELQVGMNVWQGYLLLTGLPTARKVRCRIVPTTEVIYSAKRENKYMKNKTYTKSTVLTLVLSMVAVSFSLMPFTTFAQMMPMMMQGQNATGTEWQAVLKHTKEEEAEGKVVYDALVSGSKECSDLTEDDFAVLGEYFMGVQLGESHALMNSRLMQMHGMEGEEAIHIALGKQVSLCSTTSAPTGWYGGYGGMHMGPMMWGGGMHGGWWGTGMSNWGWFKG